MNDFTLLERLGEDIAEPNAAQLAPAYARLDRAMLDAAAGIAVATSVTSRAATHRRRARRLGWTLGGIGGVLALSCIGGNAAMAIESSQTGELLREIAGATVSFEDTELHPGQYRYSATHADWLSESINADSGESSATMNEQQIDVYMPADPADDWVLIRDWGADEAVSAGKGSGVHFERLTAPYGVFYYNGFGDPDSQAEPPEPSWEAGWVGIDPADIPLENGETTYAWIDGQYTGGSASRAEDNYERIRRLLTSGLMPAPQRAALLEALALVPGVTSTPDVANLDGKTGVAFGRSEIMRMGERSEIIVDPDTGLVIGERNVTGISVFGFGSTEVVGSTAIETTVVDAVPQG